MRSLGTVRARVERLASVYPTAEEEPLFIIRWKDFRQRCPACGADLEALAAVQVRAEASAARARGDRVQMSYWPDTLPSCPRCGATLP
jgi:hypothetical protein